MYLASKYEDIYPLHSKIMSEKIAHRAITSKQILAKEVDFLQTFDFDVDFITHFDFHETYMEKIKRQLAKNGSSERNLKVLSDMTMVLIKMGIQNIDFSTYPLSVVVVASIYAATAFIKHSKKYESKETTAFCSEVRRIIFTFMTDEI